MITAATVLLLGISRRRMLGRSAPIDAVAWGVEFVHMRGRGNLALEQRQVSPTLPSSGAETIAAAHNDLPSH